MGADLCGYILVGPRKLDKAKMKRAEAWLGKVVQQAKDKDFEGRELKALLQNKFVIEQLGYSHGEGPGKAGDVAAAIAGMGNLVAEFAEVWAVGFRDQMSRNFKNHKIVVAGSA
jgi:hypothetical protein